MKPFTALLFLMLFASMLTAQNSNVQHNDYNISRSPFTNQTEPVYECIAPTDFDTHVLSTGDDKYMLYLTWDMLNQYGEWMHWDDGVPYSGIGSCPEMTAAAKWDSNQLTDYNNFKLSKMRVILNDTYFDSLIFKVWNGMDDNDMIYNDTIVEFSAGVWVEHKFETDLYINELYDELLIGYTILGGTLGNFPLGTDDGPAVIGYGDLIRADHDITWDTLTNFGMDYNWNIQFYAEDTSGNQKKFSRGSGERNMGFLGYNLYQSINDSDYYELLEFIPAETDSNFYALPFEASPDQYCYKLTALWVTPTDTCESEPALAQDNPSADSICVLMVGDKDELTSLNKSIRCYPNPMSSSTTIEYELTSAETVTITFYNQYGKQVDIIRQDQSQGLHKVIWTPKNLVNGVYYFRLEAGKKVASGKISIIQ